MLGLDHSGQLSSTANFTVLLYSVQYGGERWQSPPPRAGSADHAKQSLKLEQLT